MLLRPAVRRLLLITPLKHFNSEIVLKRSTSESMHCRKRKRRVQLMSTLQKTKKNEVDITSHGSHS